MSRIFPISLRDISKLKLKSVFPVAKYDSIPSFHVYFKSICVEVFLTPIIISVNNILQEIFNDDKLGKMIRNISCQITRNTLKIM